MPTHVLDGLESTEEGIKLLKKGDQFGEVIIDLHHVTPSFDQALIPKVANIVQSWTKIDGQDFLLRSKQSATCKYETVDHSDSYVNYCKQWVT